MTSEKIKQFLNSWKDGVIEIGKVFFDGGDYKKCAENFLSVHYAFDNEEVLFKPTFTKEVIFRNKKDDALSYFVRGSIDEDNGFALKPWESIDLVELNSIEEDSLTVAMGTFNFKPVNQDVITLVAFTFLLIKDEGFLKIKVHHSSPV
tara:strand:+ start:612 stop:1055 length:444 start_codon:yes stop_codon:yes gene_type:complete